MRERRRGEATSTVRSARLRASLDEISTQRRLTAKQRAVAELLEQVGEASVKEVCYFAGVGVGVLSTMARNGLVELFDQPVLRNPYGDVRGNRYGPYPAQ